jgi:hypothetical protein
MLFLRTIQVRLLALASRLLPRITDAAIRDLNGIIAGLNKAEARFETIINHEVDVINASYARQSKVLQNERALRNAAYSRQDSLVAELDRATRVRERIAALLA